MHTFVETPVDDPVAHELLAEYFAYRAASFPVTSGYVTTFPEPARFTAPEGSFVVVRVDGEDAGCGGIRSLAGPAAGAAQPGAARGPALPRRFEVKHLWLRPGFQGRGLGRALLTELEHRALQLGATELVLDTNASLEAAGGLYRSSGYRDIPAYNDNPNATNWYLKQLVE